MNVSTAGLARNYQATRDMVPERRISLTIHTLLGSIGNELLYCIACALIYRARIDIEIEPDRRVICRVDIALVV